MKKAKVYYAKVPNMGDILNKDIIEKNFNCKVIRRNYIVAQVSGIGSGLGNYTLEGTSLKKFLKKISGFIFPKAYIWGTGFITYKNSDAPIYKKKINFCAVRGELSKARIEKLLGKKLNIVTADAGILANTLLDKMSEKKYDVGIIAHYKEKDNPIFEKLLKKYKNSILIDVQDTPINVTKKIAECKCIISSSLHGLIIADSLRVPNIHIVVTNNLLGDGFKFDDYYSAYGLKHNFININKEELPTLKDIKNNYRITDQMIKDKSRQMLDCFPIK